MNISKHYWWFFIGLITFNPILQATDQQPMAHAVASAHPLATEAGIQILRQGGNAFDAAVTISAVLAVVEPYGSGMGGGGFWLLHRAVDQHQIMIDGREKAPLQAHPQMYLDEQGNLIPGSSIDGPLAAGIPGTPAALVHLAKKYGRLPLSDTLSPAIRLADTGFTVDEHYRRMAQFRLQAIRQSPAAEMQFLSQGEVPPSGYRIRQPDLAATLRALAEQGKPGFYQGRVANKLVQGVREAGGIWTLADLADYHIVEREPVIGYYQGHRVISAAPPSSGGIALIQMLQMLDQLPADLKVDYGRITTQLNASQVHLLSEVMRRAYADRARHLGDTDFVAVPLLQLSDRTYNRELAADIQLHHATASRPLVNSSATKGKDTTHFSVLDAAGNRVAATLSLNYPFGSGFVPPGTGVLLNDEMDDFSIQPDIPNAYGLVGSQANAIVPGKRMLSSMTPTFIEHKDRVAILGTPGGSRIISMVLLSALQAMAGAPVQDWVSLPRFHHQYLPDEIQFEPGSFSTELQEVLTKKGHQLQPVTYRYGNMQAILWDRATNHVSAASDPRQSGSYQVVPVEAK
jgi:gamma-glutamyltranspeptidase/glutathione hydrolase